MQPIITPLQPCAQWDNYKHTHTHHHHHHHTTLKNKNNTNMEICYPFINSNLFVACRLSQTLTELTKTSYPSPPPPPHCPIPPNQPPHPPPPAPVPSLPPTSLVVLKLLGLPQYYEEEEEELVEDTDHWQWHALRSLLTLKIPCLPFSNRRPNRRWHGNTLCIMVAEPSKCWLWLFL